MNNRNLEKELLEQVAINLYKKEHTEYAAWQLPNFTELVSLGKKLNIDVSVETVLGEQDSEGNWIKQGGFKVNVKEIINNLNNNNNMKNLTFGQAIEALKEGKRVSREGWNGKGLFVFMQVPSEIGKDIVPKMQSLPQSVKDEFQRRFENESEQINAIYYSNQLALVNTSNLITGWSPSTSDALSIDWFILD